MAGCANGQTAVADFINAVKEIDGVTRVAISNSTRSNSTSSGSTTPGSSTTDCSGGKLAKFDLVAAFDSVPIDPTTQAPVAPVAPASSTDSSGVADAQQQEAAARKSVQDQTSKAHDAVSTLIPGTVSK